MPPALFICATLAACVVLPISALAKEHRSASVKREFQLMHPCPATGLTRGPCPGCVKDHVVPLACGGPDAVSNACTHERRASSSFARLSLQAIPSRPTAPSATSCGRSIANPTGPRICT
jgi:hypothetical protein